MIAGWTAENEIAGFPVEQRHLACPFGTHSLRQWNTVVCANCSTPHGREEREPVAKACGCRRPLLDGQVRFEQGRWRTACATCNRVQTGSHLLGENGRWESAELRSTVEGPSGARGPEWLFAEELHVTGVSSGNVSFGSANGHRIGISVDLPGRTSLNKLHPYSLNWKDGPEGDFESIIPEQGTRLRLQELIDNAIRLKLEAAVRSEESLIRARGDVNFATRVRDLL